MFFGGRLSKFPISCIIEFTPPSSSGLGHRVFSPRIWGSNPHGGTIIVKISLAKTSKDFEKCFSVMAQLRTNLSKAEFIEKVKRQQKAGYSLVFMEDKNGVVAVAGFRISECLAWGKFLYVDDLVTDEKSRSKGYGGKLFDWLVEYAKSEKCNELHLDSGIQRFGAHKFYKNKKMNIIAHHFSLNLKK